jgi:outer membrane protein assembly factor BamB
MAPKETDSNRPPQRTRWWPLALIVALCAARLIQVCVFRDYDRQFKVQQAAKALAASGVLCVAWLLLFSRMPVRRRFRWFGAILAAIGLMAGLLRFRGFTGDLLPILEWRWKNHDTARAPSLPPPPTNAATAPGLAAATNAFPQFLGPDRSGILPGPRLADDWQARPPQLLWRRPVGAGWAGFAVQGRYAVTLEQALEQEQITCCDVTSGDRLWTHSYPARCDSAEAGIGPRSVPTLAAGRVFATGGTGILTCLDLATGTKLWSHDLVKEHQAAQPQYGFSVSPLALEEKVIVCAGGPNGHSVVAYESATGKLLWHGGNAIAGYSSPVLARLAGAPQVLIYQGFGLSAHDPGTGTVLWEFPQPSGPNVALPLVIGSNQVLISTGYGVGSRLVKVDRGQDGAWKAELVWKSIRLKSKFANPILLDGFVYGLDDGALVCLDPRDGQWRWKATRYGHGQMLLVAGRLLIMAENGEVALAEPSPERFRELTRFRALESRTWNPPALAGELLLVRNDLEAACYRLPRQ